MSSVTPFFILFTVFSVTHMKMICCSGNEVNATSGCVPRDRNALLKLKASFSDPSSRLSSWNTSTNCCTWAGVECDGLTGQHVVELHLQNERYDPYYYSQANMLSSEMIDSAILEMGHLSYLDLSGNDFQESPIPSFLGLLNQLHHLNLSYANFSGVVPHHLGNLSRLNVLNLNHDSYRYPNQLIVDDDFMWASRLPLLWHLDMGGVNLNGTKDLFKVLDMLPSIEVLHLSYSNLENRNLGRRAFVNSSLSHIQVLDLSGNSFDGELPSFLGNLTSLRDLDLSFNYYNSCSQVNLHGLTNLARLNLNSNTLDCKVDFISQVLGNNCHMESLDLAYNYFSGDISELFLLNLSRCPNHQLAALHLSENNFYGKLPEQIGAFRKLESLVIFHNNVSGPIPTSIGNLSALTALDLGYNKLSGNIPPSLWKLSNLIMLQISNNQLDGTISETHFSMLSKLQVLELGSNNLIKFIAGSDWVPPFQLTALNMESCEIVGGEFPKWLQTQKELTGLIMSNCSISGTIPYWFHYINMSGLHLSNNHIEGPLPDSFWFHSINMRSLFLSNNHIEGPLPDSLCELEHLGHLDLTNNRLSGNLPECWPDSLYNLLLSYNSFSGEFPSTLRNCTQLETLDLSSNGLSLSHIQFLDLSINSLDGELPSFLGNLTSLRDLDLSYNNYKSCSQVNLNGLTNLVRLHLIENSLNGELPSFLGNLTSLRDLDLSYNYYNSCSQVNLNGLTNLVRLHLLSNSLDCNVDSISQVLVNNCHMESLDLYYNSFSGDISELFPLNLSRCPNHKLATLSLPGNNFYGKLPEQIGAFRNLKSLDLSGNNVSGPIPTSIGNLLALTELDLSDNKLSGNIPLSLGNLSNLVMLRIYNNQLDGTISETHFSMLSKLVFLELGGNNFMKFIAGSDWVPPFQLTTLEMGSCEIVGGEFPKWLQTQKELTDLVMSNCSISGTIPYWFHYINMSILVLSNNHIEGPLPHSFCQMKYLGLLDLSNNRLSGNLPAKCWPDSLENLYLSNNSLTREVPHTLRNCTQLGVLDLSINGLSGPLPEFWANLSSLYAVILSSNQLSGVIPKSIGGAYSLLWLQLNNNIFTGEVPSSLKNCTALTVLDVGENSISEKLPKWIGNDLLNLEVLRLRSNQFYGRIPLELCQLSRLQLLDLASNKLREDIPGCFGNFSGMVYLNSTDESLRSLGGSLLEVIKGVKQEYLEILWLVVNMDLSDNDLMGEIPMELTKLTALHFFNLSHNQLQGNIPGRIRDMKMLESLDMSNNNLFGNIPVSFSDLTSLSHLNLSHNNLTGEIPAGRQLGTLEDPSIYQGNPGLCGPPLLKKCHDEKASSAPNVEKHAAEGDEDTIEKIWLYGIITSGFATGFWGAIGVLVFKRSWRYIYFSFTDGVIARMLGR